VLSEFQVALGREFARAVRYRQAISLLLTDLPASSESLGKVRDAIRLCDSAVTAPGEKVAVILPETPLAGALLVASRLAGAVGPSPKTGGPESIGIACYPSPAVADPDALLRAAGKAMEAARSAGGGIMTPPSR
jgi:hypothetical protein